MQSSKVVAAEFFGKLSSGDFEGAFESMDDHATWTIIGTTALSKKFDKAGIIREVIPLLAAFKEPPQITVDEIIAEGERAIVLANVKGIGPFGPYLQKTYAFALRIRNGTVVEITEYLDTVAVEEAICGRVIRDRVEA
jgi:ketosteroid isomerase-like protein